MTEFVNAIPWVAVLVVFIGMSLLRWWVISALDQGPGSLAAANARMTSRVAAPQGGRLRPVTSRQDRIN
jgi:hypothetical protein